MYHFKKAHLIVQSFIPVVHPVEHSPLLHWPILVITEFSEIAHCINTVERKPLASTTSKFWILTNHFENHRTETHKGVINQAVMESRMRKTQVTMS